jgi:hypothetical protein
VCEEQVQRCVLKAAVEFLPQDAEPLDAEAIDAGWPGAPSSTDRPDATTGVNDAEVTHVDAGDGSDPEDGGLVDAGTPDAGDDDPSQDAGVVITPPDLDAGNEPCASTMLGGERKVVGEYLCSRNGRYRFGLDASGALELRDGKGVIWSSATCCGDKLAMQRDGNLVVYDLSSAPRFATNTRGNDGAFLSVEDDARAVLWLGSEVIWSTDEN